MFFYALFLGWVTEGRCRRDEEKVIGQKYHNRSRVYVSKWDTTLSSRRKARIGEVADCCSPRAFMSSYEGWRKPVGNNLGGA
jgi:hypothetical protein